MRKTRSPRYVGEKFGLLTITKIETAKRNTPFKEAICECLCDCGNSLTAPARLLVRGRKKSCGCLQRRRDSQSHLWKGHGEISGAFWGAIRECAKQGRSRSIPFKITIEQGWELFLKQNRKCALTGLEINFPTASKRRGSWDQTASLDRIDSNGIYELGNVQWVHKTVNRIKWMLPENEFVQWCRLVVNHHDSSLRHKA